MDALACAKLIPASTPQANPIATERALTFLILIAHLPVHLPLVAVLAFLPVFSLPVFSRPFSLPPRPPSFRLPSWPSRSVLSFPVPAFPVQQSPYRGQNRRAHQSTFSAPPRRHSRGRDCKSPGPRPSLCRSIPHASQFPVESLGLTSPSSALRHAPFRHTTWTSPLPGSGASPPPRRP